MMFDLNGKTAVVTGAGSGIGRAIARLFARQGARLFLLDVDKGGASSAAVEFGGTAIECDVARADSVESAFERIGPLQILVNNAGVAHVGTAESTGEAEFDRVASVNVKGVYLCSRAALKRMSSGSVILNMASIAGLIGIADRFAYSMTKGAVLAMTRSIAVDFMKRGIRCNAVCPARVHTPFVDGYLSKNYPGREAEMFKTLSEYQPIGRMGTPEEVAAMALYLCSDEASFITGQAFPIDGGVLVS